MKFIPYLTFEGNAEESINFYADALGGKIEGIMLYKDAPPGEGMPPTPDDYMDKILHGSLNINGEVLYFSDAFPGSEVISGNTVEINIACDSEEQLREIYNKLVIDGQVLMPVDKMFWGAIFGSIKDKFGIGWNLNYDFPQE